MVSPDVSCFENTSTVDLDQLAWCRHRVRLPLKEVSGAN